jgi:SAM-dependent methyltransferase
VSGPGAVTADGCPVEVYRRLPAMGEPELVDALIRPRARVLDLGAGTGRIADPLAGLGHDVVAVDDSAEMLAHVRRARPHRARIEDLDLGERFDAVLLASHLVNTPDDGLRRALLGAARRHLDDGDRMLLQWHEPEWFDRLVPGVVSEGAIGGIGSRFEVHAHADGVLDGTVSYTDGEHVWSQRFQAARLDRARMAAELAAAGLVPDPEAPAAGWLLAFAG